MEDAGTNAIEEVFQEQSSCGTLEMESARLFCHPELVPMYGMPYCGISGSEG